IDVIRPKVASEEKFVLGLPSCGWLKTLKASTRNDKRELSVIRTLFDRAVSIWNRPGPSTIFRPAVPHRPFGGSTNAAGLIHWLMVRPLVGMSDTPGTRSGRWFWLLPSGSAVALREIVTVSGSPVRTEPTLLSSQPRRNLGRPSGSG